VSDVAHEPQDTAHLIAVARDSLAAQSKGPNRQLIERPAAGLQRLPEPVGDLLELSQLENSLPVMSGEYEVLDLAERVQEVWTTCAPCRAARRNKLSFPSHLPALLWGDSSRLQPALLTCWTTLCATPGFNGVVEVRLPGANQCGSLEIREHVALQRRRPRADV